jgi:EamA domain-containing membrane protein RarD
MQTLWRPLSVAAAAITVISFALYFIAGERLYLALLGFVSFVTMLVLIAYGGPDETLSEDLRRSEDGGQQRSSWRSD